MRFATCIASGLVLLSCDAADIREEGPATLSLEEVTRYGSFDAEGSALTSVVGIALTDSSVLVLESQPPRVAVFDRRGEWRRDIGRGGDGPGELRYPTTVGVADGQIWVGDPFGGRLEVFHLNGSSIASYRWSIPPDSLGERAMPTALLDDGSILAAPRRMIRESTTNRSYYSATESGEVLALLYREAIASGDIFSGGLSGGAFVVGRHPLPESPLVVPYPDGSGVLVVERPEADTPFNATFRVVVITSGGATQLDLNVPYVPVSAEGWLDSYIAQSEREMLEQNGTVNRDLLAVYRQGLVDRRFYPPVTDAVAGMDGSIWLRREEVDENVTWQVFDHAGALTAMLSTSPALDLSLVSLDEVWAVERDALDVPYVVRFRVMQ